MLSGRQTLNPDPGWHPGHLVKRQKSTQQPRYSPGSHTWESGPCSSVSDGGSDRTGSGFGARRTDISLKILPSEETGHAEKSQQPSHSLAPRDGLALPLDGMLAGDQLSFFFNFLNFF